MRSQQGISCAQEAARFGAQIQRAAMGPTSGRAGALPRAASGARAACRRRRSVGRSCRRGCLAPHGWRSRCRTAHTAPCMHACYMAVLSLVAMSHQSSSIASQAQSVPVITGLKASLRVDVIMEHRALMGGKRQGNSASLCTCMTPWLCRRWQPQTQWVSYPAQGMAATMSSRCALKQALLFKSPVDIRLAYVCMCIYEGDRS